MGRCDCCGPAQHQFPIPVISSNTASSSSFSSSSSFLMRHLQAENTTNLLMSELSTLSSSSLHGVCKTRSVRSQNYAYDLATRNFVICYIICTHRIILDCVPSASSAAATVMPPTPTSTSESAEQSRFALTLGASTLAAIAFCLLIICGSGDCLSADLPSHESTLLIQSSR